MEHAMIESRDLDMALLHLDIYKDKYVVVKVDYVWNSVSETHRFDICYVDKNLCRQLREKYNAFNEESINFIRRYLYEKYVNYNGYNINKLSFRILYRRFMVYIHYI